jgi:cytochrome oxidase assembly protein ShyY1
MWHSILTRHIPNGMRSVRNVSSSGSSQKKQSRDYMGILLFSSLCVGTFYLGRWQQRRLAWKNGLQAQRDDGLAGTPLSVASCLQATDDERDTMLFRPVRDRGTFDYSRKVKLTPRAWEGRSGAHWIVPFTPEKGNGPDEPVLVNLGWVPLKPQGKETLPSGKVCGTLNAVMVPAPKQASYPNNDPASGQWYWGDLRGIASHLGLSVPSTWMLESRHDPEGEPIPRGGVISMQLKNDHFAYMLTWYGLSLGAAVLTVMRFRA